MQSQAGHKQKSAERDVQGAGSRKPLTHLNMCREPGAETPALQRLNIVIPGGLQMLPCEWPTLQIYEWQHPASLNIQSEACKVVTAIPLFRTTNGNTPRAACPEWAGSVDQPLRRPCKVRTASPAAPRQAANLLPPLPQPAPWFLVLRGKPPGKTSWGISRQVDWRKRSSV